MRRRSHRVRAALLSAAAATLCAIPCVAHAQVRAFDIATGAEDRGFVTLDQSTVPYLVAPDGGGGAYVFGHVRVGGRSMKIAHLLPDGVVDPRFRATIDDGSVVSVAAHGRELALLGTFRSIDGTRRVHVALLDARSGRLEPWAPTLSEHPRGQGDPHVLFVGSRLVAGVDGAVVAWRPGAARPLWTRVFRGRDEVPEIAWWHGTLLAAMDGRLSRIEPRSGRTIIDPRGFRWSELQSVGGRLVYSAQGSYVEYGRTRSVDVPCGEPTVSTVGVALAGTPSTVFVAVGPIDMETSAPATRILACRWSGARLRSFPPSPLPGVGAMVVVGSHLLVFTAGR